MINGKPTFIIKLRDQSDIDEMKSLVRDVTGNIDSVSYFELDQLIEITDDLTQSNTVHLVGYISHMLYPSNKQFIHDTKAFIEYYRNDFLVRHNLSIIKHIPHSSIDLPEDFSNKNFLRYPFIGDMTKYILKMADLHVDKLFQFVKGIEIKAPYSRLFCDVERNKDDENEPMSKFGYGYIYRKTYDRKSICRYGKINEISVTDYINKYYDEHHERLNSAIENELDKGKDVFILDCHSFSDEFADSIDCVGPYPDICIGINDDFDNQPLLNLIIKRIEEEGLNYRINFPCKGSIIPTKYDELKKKGKIYSIKISVNKKLYL